MMARKILSLFFYFGISVLVLTNCRHHPEISESEVEAPDNLLYSPGYIEVVMGSLGSSNVPTYTGDSVDFKISVTPLVQATKVYIEPDGTIKIDSTLALGHYDVTVIIANAAGAKTFVHAFAFDVVEFANPPSNLLYNPANVTINDGELHTSEAPSISGTLPFEFDLNVTPVESNITIDQSGIIRVEDTIPPGIYSIDVQVSNAGDTVWFTDAYEITVVEVAPFNMQYVPNNMSFSNGNSGVSVVPTIEGTLPITYQISSVPSNANITIDAQGVISASSALNIGTYDVSVQATNSAGTTTFSSIYTITKTPTAQAPANLVYSPNSLSINQGDGGVSVVPTVQGSTPITYSLVTSPLTSDISINSSTGVISVATSTAPGTYSVDVTATNSAGSNVFNGVYSIEVISVAAPTNLIYSPNSMSIVEGSTGSSVAPSVLGGTPLTYSLAVSPTSTGISINSSTGVISANSSVAAGTYSIDVTVTNAGGSSSFPGAYSIEVTAPVLISFANDILPLIQTKCSNCHTGGAQINFTIYSNAFSNASSIYDRVTRPQGSAGYMPKSKPPLSQAEQDLILQWINDGRQP